MPCSLGIHLLSFNFTFGGIYRKKRFKKKRKKKGDPLKDSILDFYRTIKFTIICYGTVKIEHLLPVKRGHLVSILGQEKFLSGPLSSILGRLFPLLSTCGTHAPSSDFEERHIFIHPD
jgi:hypothetical protein